MTKSQRIRRNENFAQKSQKAMMLQKIPEEKRGPLRSRLQEIALKLAGGYYITEEIPRKEKAIETVDGKRTELEKVVIVPVKRYVPPNAAMVKYLMEILSSEPVDNTLEVIFAGEALEDHCIEGYY